ncbi:MAG: nucleoid-associated protein, partial [Owenweeksia sp.]
MFDNTLSSIQEVMIHYVGNSLKDEPLQLSSQPSGMDPTTEKQLWNYLYSAFKTPEFFRFTHPVELELNNVFSVCRDIFSDTDRFSDRSGALAKLLYDHSQHPNIKSGELFVIYFKGLTFG